jgi:hypothetical protein
MAITERITLAPMTRDLSVASEVVGKMPGLRVMIRTTTASLSDYPEFSVEDIHAHRKDNFVTDGPCS